MLPSHPLCGPLTGTSSHVNSSQGKRKPTETKHFLHTSARARPAPGAGDTWTNTTGAHWEPGFDSVSMVAPTLSPWQTLNK